MGESKLEDMTLPALFDRARKIHLFATDSGRADQDDVRKGCEALEKCEEMIGKLGLFSANETKEDISTTNLKYLLVPFYLGELTEKIVQGDRIQILKASQAKLKEFVLFCESMELLPEEELQMLRRGGSETFADRRAKKIARFKRQRAAESKLLEIKERKERRGRSTKAAALSTPLETGEEDTLDDDGEEEREAWFTTISSAICKALDLLEMLSKEDEMLSAVKEKESKEDKEFFQDLLDDRTKRAETWHRETAVRSQYTKPAQPITCATFAQDVLEGRATVSQAHEHKHHRPMIFGPQSLVGGPLTTERERMAAQVFQPGHRLPTMSIEEAGLTEMNLMNEWQENTAKMMEEANSAWYKDNRKPGPSKEEEDDDDDDATQEKARAWDDWKDDNPHGAGNKKLTPCG